MSFEILTDSASNIGKALAEKNQIRVIPFPYFVNGVECSCVDSDSFDDVAYYNAMRSGTEVNTSQINPQRYIDYMESYLKEGKDLLYICIAGGISGAFHSSQIAREELLERYPQRKICLVNSLGASMGEGMLVLRAAKCRANGMEVEETAQRLDKLRMHIYQVFVVDDIRHLARTGRISNFTAAFGSMLGIRPMLKGSAEGKIVAYAKVRGMKQAIKFMADKYQALAHRDQMLSISHCDNPEGVQALVELLSQWTDPEKIMVVKHEPATGSHLGPGSLALFFEGDENVRFQ